MLGERENVSVQTDDVQDTIMSEQFIQRVLYAEKIGRLATEN